jgi:CheY-like chemotaxis protein
LPVLLYVEDEDDNWAVTELRLRKKYQLVRAADDEQACSALIRFGTKLEAILMDIQLQGSKLDGVQLTQLVRGKLDRQQLPPYVQQVPTLTIPIVFVTAYGNRYPEAQLLAAGGTAVVGKPVDFLKLTLKLASFHAGAAAGAVVPKRP